MAARFVYLTGKGGCGKTLLAELLAEGARRRGLPVLRLSLDDRDETGSVDGEPRKPTPTGTLVLDRRTALRNLLASLFRLGFIADRLLDSSSFRAVAEAAPGVTELVTLAWIEQVGSRLVKGLVVVDGPSSGHAAALLRSPQTVLGLASSGAIAGAAHNLEQLLTDPRRFRSLVVSTPEDFSLNESQLLSTELAELGVAALPPVLNAVYPLHADPAQLAWLEQAANDDQTLVGARWHQQRARRHASVIEQLESADRNAIVIPFLFGGNGQQPGHERMAAAERLSGRVLGAFS